MRPRTALASHVVAIALSALALVGPVRAAPPAPLDNDADVAAFADRLRAFAGASRVHWVVAAPTQFAADAKVAEIAARLAPADRFLASRLIGEAAPTPVGGAPTRAWIAPQFGSTGGAPSCSWQVWVTDPGIPAPEGRTLAVPMAPGDRMPVGRGATFRVGHSGLLQSKLYAFDETEPGAIRDLAAVADVNVPVASGATGDTIYLATTRAAVPFLESLKTALAASAGERRPLGPQYALRGKLLGQGRGIGANIQEVGQAMIVAEADIPPPPEAKARSEPSDALTETCLFALSPAAP